MQFVEVTERDMGKTLVNVAHIVTINEGFSPGSGGIQSQGATLFLAYKVHPARTSPVLMVSESPQAILDLIRSNRVR